MPKLHLVGITPDNQGLVLSEHARSKRGDLILSIDDRLFDALERAKRQRAKEDGQALASAALPTRRGEGHVDAVSGEARLSPREIQHRLRTGESVAALAQASGTEESWIERFAAPVFAELEQVASKARGLTLKKARGGSSALNLGDSVAANLVERGAEVLAGELEKGWSACQRATGGWATSFTFALKGRRHTAEWDVDLSTGDLTARNKLAGEIGFRENTLAPVAPARPGEAEATARSKPAPAKAAGSAPSKGGATPAKAGGAAPAKAAGSAPAKGGAAPAKAGTARAAQGAAAKARTRPAEAGPVDGKVVPGRPASRPGGATQTLPGTDAESHSGGPDPAPRPLTVPAPPPPATGATADQGAGPEESSAAPPVTAADPADGQ